MTAFAPTVDQSRRYFESRLRVSLPARKKVPAKCAFHDDRTASMSVNLEQGTWFCHACNDGGGLLDFERRLTNRSDRECWDTINATIGREPPKSDQSRDGKTITYDYHNATGEFVYQAVRYSEPKDFRQRRPNGTGGWIWNMNGITRVPFNLPALGRANVALITEGEKDALNLQKAAAAFPDDDGKRSYAATCNIGGAGKWLDEYSLHLAGKEIFVFQDNDEPGRKHAQQVCASVQKRARAVHLVELPGLPEKGDVSDYLEAHTPAELFALMETAPLWTAPVTPSTPPMRAGEAIWTTEGMDTFLMESERDT